MRLKQSLLTLALFLLSLQPAWAVIVFDAADEGNGTTSLSWTHTPSGTPAGVFVFCMDAGASTDVFSGATYDGEAMTQIANASGPPAVTIVGECRVITGSGATMVTVTGGDSRPNIWAIRRTDSNSRITTVKPANILFINLLIKKNHSSSGGSRRRVSDGLLNCNPDQRYVIVSC